MTQPQIEKPEKGYLHIVLKSSDMEFHKIWSCSCGEVASDVFLHEAPFFCDTASN